ncbi:MAG: hypothetical protein DMG77_04780 [Acidobacteria bacterium]|nr:MAG: hypothetical protein DMG77_04780 [Acidobacteriota bacterium]
MQRCGSGFLFLALLFTLTIHASAQDAAPSQSPQTAPQSVQSVALPEPNPIPPPIPANAAHISKQTRYEIIRDFETQLAYARSVFPMGTKGLKLKDGVITPSPGELQQMMAIYGPAVKVGDPAHISYVQIKDDHIHLEINGGPVRRKKWYQHIEISGTGGPMTPGNDNPQANPHGSFVDVYFDKYVPELSAQQLRDLLFPVLDFNAKNKEQAYLDTVPPKVKEAIQKHHVLVGMNQEMVVHAKGRPPKKVREKDGETDYEEWIYGEPPQDVDFVRIVADEVVRVETMKVGGEKIVRTEKEVILDQPDKDKEARKEQEERPPNAPSLRRPGEDADDVPKPANGRAPLPPPTMPSPTSPAPGNGPGDIVPATGR